MIDELDLAFDKGPDRTPQSHRRKSGGGKTAVAFLVVLLLFGTLAGGVWYGFNKVSSFFNAADYDGGGSGEVQVEIKQRSTITDIGNTLVKQDVVKSAAAFIEAAEENSKSKNIQHGVYKLKKQMSGEAAVAALLDSKNRVTNGVTIPEGKTAKDVYKLLSAKTGIPVAEYEKAAKDPIALGVPDFWFNRDDKQQAPKSVEGFLFPDTYEFPPNGDAAAHLKMMVDKFLTVAEEIKFVETVQTDRKIKPYEALIVASLSQAEAGNAEDLGKISRVAYNRLYGDFPCGCLQFDVGINYYYQLTGKPTKPSKAMTEAELNDVKNPYRTHGKPGLTPTPINNPGRAALEGAMSPPQGSWLFFVAIDKEGRSAFADTDAQHQANIAIAKKNGVL